MADWWASKLGATPPVVAAPPPKAEAKRSSGKNKAAEAEAEAEASGEAEAAKEAPRGTHIDCPFREREQAQALGAKWDQRAQKWLVPFSKPLQPFSRWLDEAEAEAAIEEHEAARIVEEKAREGGASRRRTLSSARSFS